MNKDILDIVKYSVKCEAAINSLVILMEDYKRQAKHDIPISTIEMILSNVSGE